VAVIDNIFAYLTQITGRPNKMNGGFSHSWNFFSVHETFMPSALSTSEINKLLQ